MKDIIYSKYYLLTINLITPYKLATLHTNNHNSNMNFLSLL